jgi:FMN-dependent NADH-azoreductase
MKTLLVINSSGRVTRSVTRRLTARFVETWRKRNPGSTVISRDVGRFPPSPVGERWIAAAFGDSGTQAKVLSESEALIQEVVSADAIVMGVPMYNFGVPAQLKAYFDQVVRIGRTFAYHPDSDDPYRPLLASKPCIVITSVSDAALYPDGALAHLNFCDPHLTTLWGFIGITGPLYIRAEEGLLRNPPALAQIEAEVDQWARAV